MSYLTIGGHTFYCENSWGQPICYLLTSPPPPTGIGQVASNVKSHVMSVIDLLYGLSAVTGVAVLFAGLMKLKAAADTQGQSVKYGEALWPIAIGICLIGLPMVVDNSAGTLSYPGPSGPTAIAPMSIAPMPIHVNTGGVLIN